MDTKERNSAEKLNAVFHSLSDAERLGFVVWYRSQFSGTHLTQAQIAAESGIGGVASASRFFAKLRTLGLLTVDRERGHYHSRHHQLTPMGSALINLFLNTETEVA